jgi:hypothetical protein
MVPIDRHHVAGGTQWTGITPAMRAQLTIIERRVNEYIISGNSVLLPYDHILPIVYTAMSKFHGLRAMRESDYKRRDEEERAKEEMARLAHKYASLMAASSEKIEIDRLADSYEKDPSMRTEELRLRLVDAAYKGNLNIARMLTLTGLSLIKLSYHMPAYCPLTSWCMLY